MIYLESLTGTLLHPDPKPPIMLRRGLDHILRVTNQNKDRELQHQLGVQPWDVCKHPWVVALSATHLRVFLLKTTLNIALHLPHESMGWENPPLNALDQPRPQEQQPHIVNLLEVVTAIILSLVFRLLGMVDQLRFAGLRWFVHWNHLGFVWLKTCMGSKDWLDWTVGTAFMQIASTLPWRPEGIPQIWVQSCYGVSVAGNTYRGKWWICDWG